MEEKIRKILSNLEDIKTELNDLSREEAANCAMIAHADKIGEITIYGSECSKKYNEHHRKYCNLSNASKSLDEVVMYYLRKVV